MVDNDVECLPVIDAERVLHGLITLSDIVTKVVYRSAFGWELKAEEIMTTNVTTGTLDSTVLDVVKTMKNKHLKRILVVDAKRFL